MADELGKDPATVSKWCTNSSQPSLETLVQVAEALDVDVRSLIVQTKKSRIEIEAEKFLNISSNQ
ncbi:helix-turn-helix domain-containing protein [Prevotella sp.]|uniref:helix-turn-helix domain-containing protein n=1 Tax=Prevotella sp. TaxID=59823 RepID=UPI0025D49BD3|nr:helix-turn-helix transcriptional regulator [Prevotella sp.]